jgi:dTDP-4-amino-4,6-dideoxygalactose transaminase
VATAIKSRQLLINLLWPVIVFVLLWEMQHNFKHSIMESTKEKIWLSSPHMGNQEIEYVKEAFSGNWIAPLGPNLNGFETDLETYLGEGSHVAALSSGTSAIHLALILLNVGRGDEVICQSMTFAASANPIVYQCASPIFIDSETDTWNMSPEFLEEAIKDRIKLNKKPKAIIVVHLYGMPAKIKDITAIAKKYEIPLIEDAAEALGSSFSGQKCGTFGDIGILSFNGNKIITTSAGGALVSANTEWVKKAKFLANQARDASPHYQHSQIGYNYRMSNICAGIGRGQMQVLYKRIEQRRNNYDFYKKALSEFDEFLFLNEQPGSFSNRWLTAFLVDPSKSKNGVTREQIRLALEKENIDCRPLWKPLHLQPVFKGSHYFGANVAENLFAKGLCLPSGSNLSRENLHFVVDNIANICG